LSLAYAPIRHNRQLLGESPTTTNTTPQLLLVLLLFTAAAATTTITPTTTTSSLDSHAISQVFSRVTPCRGNMHACTCARHSRTYIILETHTLYSYRCTLDSYTSAHLLNTCTLDSYTCTLHSYTHIHHIQRMYTICIHMHAPYTSRYSNARLHALRTGALPLARTNMDTRVTGMAAQFMCLTQFMQCGDNFVTASHLYGGTYNQFKTLFKQFGIEARFSEVASE
jgi:hypothetical protein